MTEQEAEHKMQFKLKYKDIFLLRIEDIEFNLESEHYMAALALALTLPDICGKAEFSSSDVTERYIKWFNQFMALYHHPTSKYSHDMPYLSGEVVYNLRNAFLHSGNPNIENGKVKNNLCKIDDFELAIGKSLESDTSVVAYGGNNVIVNRKYKVNVYLLCKRLSEVAKEYYINNKEKFDFYNYHITSINDQK